MAKNRSEEFDEEFQEDHTFKVDVENQNEVNETVLSEAREFYKVGRRGLYRAIACTIIWYEISKGDKKYIKRTFAGYSSNSTTDPYTTAFKVMFNFDQRIQASTISKYKDTARNLISHPKFKNRTITDYSQALLDEMANFIDAQGGIDKLSRAHLETDKSTVKSLSQRDVTKIRTRYLGRKRKPIGQLALSAKLKINDTDLVSMLGRKSGEKIEIMAATVDKDLVNRFIRTVNTKS